MSRTSPRTIRRATAALACTILFAGAAPAAIADDLHDQQKAVQKQLASARGEFHDSSKTYAAALTRLTNAKAQLTQAQAKLARTQGDLASATAYAAVVKQKLVAAQQAVKVGQAKVAAAKVEVANQRAAVGQTAADNYRYGDPTLLRLSVILLNKNPNLITTQDQAMVNVMERQNVMLEALRQAQALLEAEEKRLRAAEAQVQVEQKAAAANVATTQRLTAQAASEESAVEGLVTERKDAESAAADEKAADLEKLKELQAEDARIRSMIMRQAGGNTTTYNGDTGGFLYRPVPGGITSAYGYRIHPIYKYYGLHDGNDYSASCGSPMAAAGTGKVTSQYYSSIWGNRLFLNLGTVNGKNMTVIYNHISRYAVSTGAVVKRGQTVAYAGTTGWSTGCHLHFTVMVNGSPVNPNNYM
ncbi:MAG TPA: peptidoglycan DD-metalloendopeptidase family protein [Marmoricola sp.]|nr:peptidoglycan DD-metalloendopeptidase family protein [Nocardioidaceae bacterium]MCB8993877.1 peptidoglycan DD-metalloendopeptidase family protein [Nocardioidaceae bacterium]MCO5325100.1 peptidoglycan DD-metalloendopeptidase family protein [Nocardioidaceae bacterium]HRV68022.1 peptidoglycan DD-metalloendopeptidase family protein [Marmoricola sp.]